MENTKKKVERLPSTIVIGILLSIALTLLDIAYFIDIQDIIKQHNSSPDSSLGEGIGAAVIVTLMVIVLFILCVSSFLISSITLPFSISNRKASLKAIRIINIIYDILSGVIILLSILRIILLYVGVI